MGWLRLLIWSGLLAGCEAAPETNAEKAEPLRQSPARREITAEELAGPPGGLCRTDELVIFQCAAARKRVALCAGRTRSGERSIQYRFGTPDLIELVFPPDPEEGPTRMHWARHGYSGGGEMQVRFATGGFDYVVYSRVVRTGFGPDGHFDPRFESGVAVVRDNRLVSDITCREPPDPWVHEQGIESFLPEGEFFPWWDLENPPEG